MTSASKPNTYFQKKHLIKVKTHGNKQLVQQARLIFDKYSLYLQTI